MDPSATDTTNDARSNKRVRIDDGTTNPPHANQQGNQQQRQSPTKAASEAFGRSVESLPESLAPIVNHYGRQIIDIRSKIFNKTNIHTKMENDDDYIPKSAKASAFKITVSKAAAEKTEKIEFLEGQLAQAKSMYEQSLKGIVLECVQLEIEVLKKAESDLISELLLKLAEATSTNEGVSCNLHCRVRNVIALDTKLFRYAPKKSADDVIRAYKMFHSIEAMPPTTILTQHAEYATQEELEQATTAAAAAAARPENKGMQTYRKALEAILVTPQRQYLAQYESNQRAIAMKKLATDIVEGKKTEETAMELDAEAPANMEQLQDLVRKIAEEKEQSRDKKYENLARKCGALEKELQQLQKKQPPKNGPARGRTPGTSDKKKQAPNRTADRNKNKNERNDNQQRSSQRSRSLNRTRGRGRGNRNSPPRARNRGAADGNNDTEGERSGRNRNNSNRRSQGRRSRSRTRNDRR